MCMKYITVLLKNISICNMTILENCRKIMLWHCVFIVSILLTQAISSEKRSDDAPSSISSEKCKYNFTNTGKMQLPFEEECNVHYINLEFENKTSIINITLSIQKNRDVTNLTENEQFSESNFTIKVYETTENDDGEKEDILQEEWDENQSQVPVRRNYLSKTPNVCINFSSTGNWSSRYDIIFSFDEIQLQQSLRIVDNCSQKGEIEDEYQPNAIMLYRFLPEPTKIWEGIEITVETLNIREDMGEYLLIGEGTEIFKSKEYLPLFVTALTHNSSFYIGNSSAYLAFVSGPVQKTNYTIKILWSCKEIKPLKPKEDPLGVFNSSLICFYNYTAALQEFEKKEDERFKVFRKKFAEFVQAYENKKNIDGLDETSIILFGDHTEVQIDGINSNALSILIKVIHEGKSIFTWKKLQGIIQAFEENDKNHFLGYKVGKCPIGNEDLPYKNDWSFLIYAMVPLFGFFALMIWAWKHHIFSQKCKPEKEEKLCPPPLVAAEPNQYETTVPTVCLYDVDCRRETLIQGSVQPEEEGRDEEIPLEMDHIPSTSREPDTLARYLTSRRCRNRPSIQSLIDRDEENSGQSHNGGPMPVGNESEHVYDSVSREIDETRL